MKHDLTEVCTASGKMVSTSCANNPTSFLETFFLGFSLSTEKTSDLNE